MPEFDAGIQKTATVPVTNPTAKGFDYRMELYMGTTLTKMAEVSFHLNAGEQKSISLPVTMPTEAGTYPVHLGLYSGETVFGPYKAEDVVIVVPTLLEILSLTLNGSTHLTVNPRAGLSAQVLVKANQNISFDDVHIYFGKSYDKGTEPPGFRYIYIDDKAFLIMPIQGEYNFYDGFGLLITYFNGHSQLRGSYSPWYYSSGHSVWNLAHLGSFSLTAGDHSLAFPRPDLPAFQTFLPVRVSDEIRGTLDALVLVGNYNPPYTPFEPRFWAIFKDILTIKTSPQNPEQLSVDDWISQGG